MTKWQWFRNWWMGQYRSQGMLGKAIWLTVPLLFGCCALTMISVIINPPEPATEMAQRGVTVEAAESEPTATVELVSRVTDTVRPIDTPRPIDTVRPTATERATNTPRPTNTMQPTAISVMTAAPQAAATATNPPAPTMALPTATAVTGTSTQGETAVVLSVIDGDTIEVSMNGATYRVRYIGMDTPEVGQACGSEATQANAALVAGRTVRMVKDVSETDRYGRLLRYVYVGDTFVNGALVSGGWAVAKDYPPDTAMSATLHSLVSQGAGRGCDLVAAPLPTAVSPPPALPPVVAGGALRIIGVDKRAEFVDIRNDSGADVSLAGWTLRSENGSQDCPLDGVLGAGQVLRIWAMAEDVGRGGYNCGFGKNIWNNSESDPAVLLDPSGAEVSRW